MGCWTKILVLYYEWEQSFVGKALGLKEFRFIPCAGTDLSCDLWQITQLPCPHFPPLQQGTAAAPSVLRDVQPCAHSHFMHAALRIPAAGTMDKLQALFSCSWRRWHPFLGPCPLQQNSSPIKWRPSPVFSPNLCPSCQFTFSNQEFSSSHTNKVGLVHSLHVQTPHHRQ